MAAIRALEVLDVLVGALVVGAIAGVLEGALVGVLGALGMA